jgi:glycosyltransferase involved in cell wall biosynthesis
VTEKPHPRVLQIFKYYAPHVGGVEKVAQDIAEGLKDRVSTRVLTCHEALRTHLENVNGVNVTRAGRLATYFSVPLAPRFPFFMRQMAREADILHFHLPYPWADFSYLLARPHGRVVAWWHSEIVRPKYLTKLYKPFLKHFLKKADRIIVAAPQLVDKSPFLSQFKDKCRVIPIGIDTNRFRMTLELEEGIRAIRKKHENKKIILFVGRLIYYKGLGYLIEAMAQVSRSDAILLVVGEGPLRPQLEALAEERGISDRIVFLGKLADQELLFHFHACSLFVLPSVASTEAFGIVQLEAMACRKPVISTDLPTGVPFVNQHEKTGLIVPPANAEALSVAINKLLDNEVLAQKYGEAARQRVQEEFTIGVMLKRVLALYKEVLSSHPVTVQ